MIGAHAQLIATGVVYATHRLLRDPCQSQRPLRPGFIIQRDAGRGDSELPALLPCPGHVRRQIIHAQTVRFRLALPACTALFQPHVAAGNLAFADGHPPFKAETGAIEGDVVLHPFAQPRLNVDVIRL